MTTKGKVIDLAAERRRAHRLDLVRRLRIQIEHAERAASEDDWPNFRAAMQCTELVTFHVLGPPCSRPPLTPKQPRKPKPSGLTAAQILARG